jgi:signal transduction histidine kinase
VRAPALGEAVTQLPWLSPSAASLLALVREPAATAWLSLRQDPGAVLLIVRQASRRLTAPGLSFFPALLRDAVVLEGALRFLPQPAFVAWDQNSIRAIYETSRACGWLAARLAQQSRLCDAENAWVAGLLAPLGWLAVAAVGPDLAHACLTDANLTTQPQATQQHYWSIDHQAITRRLLRSWAFPTWLTQVLGHLDLPVDVARGLGADADLLRIVQLAAGMLQQRLPDVGQGGPNLANLGLVLGTDPETNAATLGLTVREQDLVWAEFRETRFPSLEWLSPAKIPYFRDLLTLAAENLRLKDAPRVEQLERECDDLHQALQAQHRGEAARLQSLKLHALAEFAAGAAHEINNPLAVMSGQAQYLLGHLTESAHQKALQTIINQAQRIHHVLTDVMQFARPARPQPQTIDVRVLIGDLASELGDLARQRDVQLLCSEPEQPLYLHADAQQIRTALECLLRNAIEAAPGGGWARLRVLTPEIDQVELVVEDNGSGPPPQQREHLFDPFFSGRPAGRGRGLGLPTAWRLAREHGGNVRYDGLAGGPTRFVMSLPVGKPPPSLPVCTDEPAAGLHSGRNRLEQAG